MLTFVFDKSSITYNEHESKMICELSSTIKNIVEDCPNEAIILPTEIITLEQFQQLFDDLFTEFILPTKSIITDFLDIPCGTDFYSGIFEIITSVNGVTPLMYACACGSIE